jgi:hypothetical protein
MTLRYQTGEDIRQGDRVTYDGGSGIVELLAEATSRTPEEAWLFATYGAGIMVSESPVFGRVYVEAPFEDPVLVGRAE